MNNFQRSLRDKNKSSMRDCAPGYWLGGVIEKLVPGLRSAQAAPVPRQPMAPTTDPTPASPPVESPAVQGPSVGDVTREYVTGLRRREAAAGLAHGGTIRGPGGPTDDDVLIRASDGEVMINAEAAKLAGYDKLEALNEKGRDVMRAKGTLRDPKPGAFALGGPIDPENDPALRRQIPTPGADTVHTAPTGMDRVASALPEVERNFNAAAMATPLGGATGAISRTLRAAHSLFPAASAMGSAPPALAPEPAPGAGAGRGFVNPPVAAPDAGAGAGRGFVNPPAVNPDAPTPSMPTLRNRVEFAPGYAGSLDDTMRQTRNIQETMADVNSQRPTALIMPDRAAERNKQFDIDVARSRADSALRLDPKRGAAVASQYNAQADQMERSRMQERSDRAQTLRQGMSDATTRRGQDVAAASNERTVAATLRGQDVSARVAGMKARQDQMNSDRQFQLDKDKFGVEVAEKNRTAREQGEKQLFERATRLFTTPDPKTGLPVEDKAKAADFIGTAQQSVGQLAEFLTANGNADKAKLLRERGLSALDDQDIAMLHMLYQRRERWRASRGLSMFGAANGKDSTNLLDFAYEGQNPGVLQQRLRFAGGQEIGVNDLESATGPVSAFWPTWFSEKSNALMPTNEERRRASLRSYQ